jgi:hypothetical protein
VELKEELCDTGLALGWRKQEEYNFRDITKIVTGIWSDTESQNIVKNIVKKEIVNTKWRN